jgi:hypothetical protein
MFPCLVARVKSNPNHEKIGFCMKAGSDYTANGAHAVKKDAQIPSTSQNHRQEFYLYRIRRLSQILPRYLRLKAV